MVCRMAVYYWISGAHFLERSVGARYLAVLSGQLLHELTMKGFVTNIEQATLENEDFRRVLYTAKNSQLVLMSIPAGTDIGEEVHDDVDQFIRVEEGVGQSVLDGVERDLTDGSAVVVPAGVRHNIRNTSHDEALKLYTIYAPPHHADGTVHKTKEEAEKSDEHFDGETTDHLKT